MRMILFLLLFSPLLAFAGDDKPPPISPPQWEDKWLGRDKALHFTVSLGAGVACSQLFPTENLTAVGCAMIPGVVKEFADSQTRGNRWSNKDMLWNLAGAVVGVKVGNLILTPRGAYYRAEF